MKQLLLIIYLLTVNGFADYAKNPSPEMNEEMKQIMQRTSPGEHHLLLKSLVGNWKTTSKWWMDANAKPEESKGTQSNKLIMGGRFIQTEHKGRAMGQPFTGMGLLGYDNVRGEYQSIWLDSMSTAISNSTGTYDATTKTLSENGTSSCPMTGNKNQVFRGIWVFTDKTHYTYTMYTQGKDGQEYKALEINYTKG